jgi:hypothetical protein
MAVSIRPVISLAAYGVARGPEALALRRALRMERQDSMNPANVYWRVRRPGVSDWAPSFFSHTVPMHKHSHVLKMKEIVIYK